MERMRADYDECDDFADNAESNLSWLGRCCWCCNCLRPSAKPQKGWGKKHFKHGRHKSAQQHPRTVARQGEQKVRGCFMADSL